MKRRRDYNEDDDRGPPRRKRTASKVTKETQDTTEEKKANRPQPSDARDRVPVLLRDIDTALYPRVPCHKEYNGATIDSKTASRKHLESPTPRPSESNLRCPGLPQDIFTLNSDSHPVKRGCPTAVGTPEFPSTISATHGPTTFRVQMVPYRDHAAELGTDDMTSDFGFTPTTGSESSGTLHYHATHSDYQTSEMMSSRLINPFSVDHHDPRSFTPFIPGGSNSTSNFVGNLDSQSFESPVSHVTEMQSTSEFVWSDPYAPLGYSATHIPGAEDGSFAYPSTRMPYVDVPSSQYEETSIVTWAPDTSFDGLLASDSDKCNRVPTPGGASSGQSFQS
ncbi:hypothetical protein C8Q74DRAFT_1215282 [Fomes fomentarius]|nr:hypothetical protein C8Q74DRAFT_1215282 [Fomes fomentarius]